MNEKLKTLIKPIVEQLGFILYDVVYEKEGNEWFLRVIIDSEERDITLDDCVLVTETLNPISLSISIFIFWTNSWDERLKKFSNPVTSKKASSIE